MWILGWVLALLCLPYQAMAQTDDYPVLTVNLTFPATDCVIRKSPNWTMTDDTITGKMRRQHGVYVSAEYYGSAMYLTGRTIYGENTEMVVFHDPQANISNTTLPWSDRYTNLVPGVGEGTRLQNTSVQLLGDYGGVLSKAIALYPDWNLENVTFTTSIKTQV